MSGLTSKERREIRRLKAECERHIKAAAHKELDWFSEKRRADLVEAKCADWERHMCDSHSLPDICCPANPGQRLLDRLEKAEADATYGKSLSKELGQKCDALKAENENLERLREAVADLGQEYLEDNYPKVAEALAACPKETHNGES